MPSSLRRWGRNRIRRSTSISGNMHLLLQMNLGRDYRAWFIEGKYLDQFEDGTIYALRVVTKKEAKHLIQKIDDARAFAERATS